MDTSIAHFHENFYIKAIKNLTFHFSYVHILGTRNCDKELCEAFQRKGSYQYVKRKFDRKDNLVASFNNQIQYEYYGGDIYIYLWKT